jgi:hypothetical protein
MKNNEFLQEWSDALISGNYSYGKGMVYNLDDCTVDAFGVAFHVLMDNGALSEDDDSWFNVLVPSWHPVMAEYIDGVNEQLVIELSDRYGFAAVAIYLNSLIDEDYDG